ncbi:hypothetical protein PCANC_16823 [Puccinia coronata f. sp. avenae]|uniref:Uncharacterized protein n=1 Tax=Puccinia coronata f. sp. avenae TaxID=200324 RepID=A0A2N5SJP4_9BASI|nr:hypothetical protein PCANC_16823 [Puccinia coronata f. sp. avenae]
MATQQQHSHSLDIVAEEAEYQIKLLKLLPLADGLFQSSHSRLQTTPGLAYR